MWWLALTAAGFVMSTALVVALAMPATARWEAEVRSGRAPASSTRRSQAGARPPADPSRDAGSVIRCGNECPQPIPHGPGGR